uniref:Uncharacterized protein n=1 Tax=Gopherus evgoodei TaxID=1825980 RepID=A0A8C4W4W7_9SAUR
SHTLGTCSRLVTVQSKHNLMIPEQRSLNLFTMNPPRNVPPPPAEKERIPSAFSSSSESLAPKLRK